MAAGPMLSRGPRVETGTATASLKDWPELPEPGRGYSDGCRSRPTFQLFQCKWRNPPAPSSLTPPFAKRNEWPAGTGPGSQTTLNGPKRPRGPLGLVSVLLHDSLIFKSNQLRRDGGRRPRRKRNSPATNTRGPLAPLLTAGRPPLPISAPNVTRPRPSRETRRRSPVRRSMSGDNKILVSLEDTPAAHALDLPFYVINDADRASTRENTRAWGAPHAPLTRRGSSFGARVSPFYRSRGRPFLCDMGYRSVPPAEGYLAHLPP